MFSNINFNLHVCGGNAHRKRGFFGKYTDMIEAFKKLNVNEIDVTFIFSENNLYFIFFQPLVWVSIGVVGE